MINIYKVTVHISCNIENEYGFDVLNTSLIFYLDSLQTYFSDGILFPSEPGLGFLSANTTLLSHMIYCLNRH